jgi:hypothetical protein
MSLADHDDEGVELVEESGVLGCWIRGEGLAGESGKGFVSTAAGGGRGRG